MCRYNAKSTSSELPKGLAIFKDILYQGVAWAKGSVDIGAMMTEIYFKLQALVGDFLPAITVQMIVLGVVYYFRDRIGKYLDHRVKHGFDVRITELKDKLYANAKNIEAMRSDVFRARAHRSTTIESRKLLALEKVWSGIIALQQQSGAVTTMALLDFVKTANKTKNDTTAKKFFSEGVFLKNKELYQEEVQFERPYLSVQIWSLYEVYKSIVIYSSLQIDVIQSGVGPELLKEPDEIIEAIASAVPNMADTVRTRKTRVFPQALKSIENEILKAIKGTLNGDEADQAAAIQAAKVIDLIQCATLKIKEGQIQGAIQNATN